MLKQLGFWYAHLTVETGMCKPISSNNHSTTHMVTTITQLPKISKSHPTGQQFMSTNQFQLPANKHLQSATCTQNPGYGQKRRTCHVTGPMAALITNGS